MYKHMDSSIGATVELKHCMGIASLLKSMVVDLTYIYGLCVFEHMLNPNAMQM